MVSSFLVFLSSFCSSSWCQSTIPKLFLSTSTATDPIAWILFFAFNSVPKTSLSLLKYSFFSFSFSFLCCMSQLSPMPKYLYAFLGSSSLMSFSIMFLICILLWSLRPFKHILAHLYRPKLICMSLLYYYYYYYYYYLC